MARKKSMLELHRVGVEQYKEVEKLPVTVVLDNVRSESVSWQYYATTLDAINILKSEGYNICSIEQVHDSVSLEDYSFNGGDKIAIVLGNEVKGVSQEVVDASDVCVEIPQHGTKHSLNISCCAAIVMWQAYQSAINLAQKSY